MTTCRRDPYRELEVYLEKAQEDIGKAFDELLLHEKSLIQSKHNNSASVLPPPPAFRSSSASNVNRKLQENVSIIRTNGTKVNSNVDELLNFKRTSELLHPHVLQKSLSCSECESFMSKPNSGWNSQFVTSNKRNACEDSYSSSKQYFQRFCPVRSASGNTTFQLENGFSNSKQINNKHLVDANDKSLVNDQEARSYTLKDNNTCKMRQKSKPKPPFATYNTLPISDNRRSFPRPPSGDVNLLSIWADNLVLAIDKSLVQEMDNSSSSLSPLSDYSSSPSKPDNESNWNLSTSSSECAKNDNFPVDLNPPGYALGDNKDVKISTHLENGHLKVMSPSPDSGICQMCCDTPDGNEDVNKIIENDKTCDVRLVHSKIDLLQISDKLGCITPPPEFNDKIAKTPLNFQNGKSGSTSHTNVTKIHVKKRDVDTQVDSPLYVGNYNECIFPDDVLGVTSSDFCTQAIVSTECSATLEDYPVISTTCGVNECFLGPWENISDHRSKLFSRQISCPCDSVHSRDTLACRYALQDTTSQDKDLLLSKSSTLPKLVYRSNDNERYSCSLPKDTWRDTYATPTITPQRSASSSSSISQVSTTEIAAFMQKVNKSTYHPPSQADASSDAMDDQVCDSSTCDAVTQTTPVVPLSRSSSFTWVTECDCSDWDASILRSLSEDTLPPSPASDKDKNDSKKLSDTSLSSLSSDEDDVNVLNPPQHSGCSSLYLSACSEGEISLSSESSSEEITFATVIQKPQTLNQKKVCGNGVPSETESNASINLLQNTNEQPFKESDFPISSNNYIDNVQSSTSLPSTPRCGSSKVSEVRFYRNQPIEANVLVVNELATKSASAPVLQRLNKFNGTAAQQSSSRAILNVKLPLKVDLPIRSQSSRESEKLQAVEACSWLNEAGFPQYVQMYEDNLFPVDLNVVRRDHANLHPDEVDTLMRRLNTLNRCACMKVSDIPQRSGQDDVSDEEDNEYALSSNWQFDRNSKRWSRIQSPTSAEAEYQSGTRGQSLSPRPRGFTSSRRYLTPEEAYAGSHDSVFVDEHCCNSPDSVRRSSARNEERFFPVMALREGKNSPGSSSGSGGALSFASEDMHDKRSDKKQQNGNSSIMNRSGSGKFIKESAKSLLRRVESISGRKKKKKGAKNEQDAGPSAAIGGTCQSLTSSPVTYRTHSKVKPHAHSNGNQENVLEPVHGNQGLYSPSHSTLESTAAHSDSECSLFVSPDEVSDAELMRYYIANQKTSEISLEPLKIEYHGGTRPKEPRPQTYGSSMKKHKDHSTKKCDDQDTEKRISQYDNLPAPLVVFNDACVENLDNDYTGSASGNDAASYSSGNADINEGEIIIINKERRDSGVGASFIRDGCPLYAPWHSFPDQPSAAAHLEQSSIPVSHLTAEQAARVRKYALLKLTTIIEKSASSSRAGWSWVMPTFSRQYKESDYKKRATFGVPLSIMLQRTGIHLPLPIRRAINHLMYNISSTVGLFRKSGVRSRILKLREVMENSTEDIKFTEHNPHDVADLVKQYFRDLPESVLTGKLTDTFVNVYHRKSLFCPSISEDQKLDAIQAAILLLPDENREVLEIVLSLLLEVADHADVNQMNATNLAVCFAPSLFQIAADHSTNASPSRRKTLGTPDLKELNDNRAAHDCLAAMVTNFDYLFSVPEEMLYRSRLCHVSDNEPAHLDELSQLVNPDTSDWRVYVEGCIQSLLKESKDNYEGWVTLPQTDNVDIAYKNVDDDFALRLWKVSVEVEAPPTVALHVILKERHNWDPSFLNWKIVKVLSPQADIFHYVAGYMIPHPNCEFCVLRSWKTELERGACVLIEASVNYAHSNLMADSVRGVILASRYLIEPCGSGKSRVTHISRVDTRGRARAWYNRAYGQLCVTYITKICESLSHLCTVGRETKV